MRAIGASRTSVATGGILGANWARNPLWKNARAVPSLDLRFAENKSLTDAKTGASLVTFTRASTGTYVGSDGVLQSATTNEARFDHNPTTGESLGLLVEEARTNLLIYSENFGTQWSPVGSSITVNTTVAPDGQTAADTIIEDTSTGNHSVVTQGISNITWAGNTVYTCSIYAKASTRSYLVVAFGTSTNWVSGNRQAVFNLSNGTIFSQAGSPVTASIQALGNGWYRCVMSATTIASPVTSAVQFQLHDGSSASYTGNGTSGLFLWGAQLEAGAFVTSYIPTTSATVTRAADVASITGTAFSSFYNQTEGTFFVDSNQASITGTLRMVSANDNTSSNRINLTRASSSGGNINFVVTNAGTNQVNGVILGSSLAVGTSNKVAAGYKAADFGGSVNGLTPVTQSTGTVPSSLTQLTIANGDALGTTPVNSTIKRLTYWPVRLANTTLQAITQP